MSGLLSPGPDNESLKKIAANTGKPEYKIWFFWLSIIAIIISMIALLK